MLRLRCIRRRDRSGGKAPASEYGGSGAADHGSVSCQRQSAGDQENTCDRSDEIVGLYQNGDRCVLCDSGRATISARARVYRREHAEVPIRIRCGKKGDRHSLRRANRLLHVQKHLGQALFQAADRRCGAGATFLRRIAGSGRTGIRCGKRVLRLIDHAGRPSCRCNMWHWCKEAHRCASISGIGPNDHRLHGPGQPRRNRGR